MSKKKKIILIISILLAILVGFMCGSAFAKYQSQITGQGVADIAKWVFNVNGNGSTIQTITLAENCDENTLINGKIAPGTKGDFDILIDATGSEVGIEYNINFVNDLNKPTNLKFFYNDTEYSNLQELKDVLVGTIDANDDNKQRTITIYWEWKYETGTNEEEKSNNDIIDTQEGIQDLNYTFDVIVTGTQIMPQS